MSLASARDVATGYCLGTPLRAEIEARTPGDTACASIRGRRHAACKRRFRQRLDRDHHASAYHFRIGMKPG